jgi:hypothetical protein
MPAYTYFTRKKQQAIWIIYPIFPAVQATDDDKLSNFAEG